MYVFCRLLAHVDDPSLDDESTREYILYMCPASGPLCESLEQFWSETELSAPNGAHESFPHIRLTTFFKVRLWGKINWFWHGWINLFVCTYEITSYMYMYLHICAINDPYFIRNLVHREHSSI